MLISDCTDTPFIWDMGCLLWVQSIIHILSLISMLCAIPCYSWQCQKETPLYFEIAALRVHHLVWCWRWHGDICGIHSWDIWWYNIPCLSLILWYGFFQHTLNVSHIFYVILMQYIDGIVQDYGNSIVMGVTAVLHQAIDMLCPGFLHCQVISSHKNDLLDIECTCLHKEGIQ